MSEGGNRFRKGLVGDVKAKISYQDKQKNLRERYHVEKEDVVIVEKSNMMKFLVRAAGAAIRILARIILIILATIGIIALLYPETRTGLQVILTGILEQIHMLLLAA